MTEVTICQGKVVYEHGEVRIVSYKFRSLKIVFILLFVLLFIYSFVIPSFVPWCERSFSLYVHAVVNFAFISLQLNVVRGSGRFIPTPPYPSYMYGRILKRDVVSIVDSYEKKEKIQYGRDGVNGYIT